MMAYSIERLVVVVVVVVVVAAGEPHLLFSEPRQFASGIPPISSAG
ncbi:hypothetical protein E2C01_097050 [Portunus trituberculatus]|uniref:Uncharacterized protein n=1 Tax=Portunus trituberculatus TaxID=210409 RepID=A0A5B7K8H8_PORTR|nr:hypothetical protein [Portunus trituberculatus]